MPELRESGSRPGPEMHWESWSRNGEVCIAGLDPPLAGGARLASCLTWLLRSFASHCRRTQDATGEFAFTCTRPRMPSTLGMAMALSFDVALRDPKLIRARMRRRGGDGAARRWPALWLEGSVYEYVISRDPFPPVGTPRRRILILAEERQVFVPARAATLPAHVQRAWEKGLGAAADVEQDAVADILDEDERGFLMNVLVLVHAWRGRKVHPRPSLAESWKRHDGLIIKLAPPAEVKALPIAWHALWRLPPAITWSAPGGKPRSGEGIGLPITSSGHNLERTWGKAMDEVPGRIVHGGRAAIAVGEVT